MTGTVEYIFYVKVDLHPGVTYLVDAYRRFLKDHGYEYVDNNKDFWTNPEHFKYLYIRTGAKQYSFIDQYYDDCEVINLENDWVSAVNNILTGGR